MQLFLLLAPILLLFVGTVTSTDLDDAEEISKRYMEWVKSHGGTLDGVDIVTHNRDYRQLITKRAVKKDEVLAKIPPSIILTPSSVMEDPILKKVVEGSTLEWGQHTRLLMGLFLLTNAKEDSVWKHFVEFLPLQMSTPHFFNAEELSLLKGICWSQC